MFDGSVTTKPLVPSGKVAAGRYKSRLPDFPNADDGRARLSGS